MPVGGQGTPEEYRRKIRRIGDPVTAVSPQAREVVHGMVDDLHGLPVVDRDSLAALIQESPEYVPALASIVGLSLERLKGHLREHLGSEAWTTRSRMDPRSIIDTLDTGFELVRHVDEARGATYTLADVILAQVSARARAGGAVSAGRKLEDAVETVVSGLGLPFEPRTRFEGSGGGTGPADFAIPSGGAKTRIAVGVKGFDSTGTKLTDAVGEVRQMAEVRRPGQYVFAVVDGIGWLRRGGDLDRFIRLVRSNEIDGLFPLEEFDVFERELRDAAVRVRLLEP